jgi:hypothetical protein
MSETEILVIVVGLVVGYVAVSKLLNSRDKEVPKRPDSSKPDRPWER